MSKKNDTFPLDPLTPDEVAATAAIVRAQSGMDDTAWFETITLDEPKRDAEGALVPAPRRAYACCYERSSNRTFRGFVDLDGGKLIEWNHVPGRQARIVPDEFSEAGRYVKADPRFAEALAKRGITDLDTVLMESWCAGNFGIEEEEGQRLAYCHCWVINDAGDNRYGRPIGGLHPVVDLHREKLVRIDDFGVVPLPPDSAPIRPTEGLREDIKPLEITQRDGPSFKVEGYGVEWQRWKMRIGYDLREGLVIHDIGYTDPKQAGPNNESRHRPIMRRASMAEMVVPYGDPTGGNYRRNAFDTGEYGIGNTLDSLTLGCDCLGHIRYFDVCAHDWQGKPRPIKNAVCMHEEDYGLLWKHRDAYTDKFRAVRSRRLVISSIATIGNYAYGFFWYFYQDGTIGTEIKATGIPFPSAIAPGEKSQYGAVVAPGIQSHVHQHAFSFRFEMAVDGPGNSVHEMEFLPKKLGPDNPYGNAVEIVDRPLTHELDAQRVLNPPSSRGWKVTNPGRTNAYGEPTAYKLVPGANTLPLLHPDAPVSKRAAYMFKHFWATKTTDGERFPAGWYPNQNPGGDGLPKWTTENRSLENTDITVWYTLSFNHLPRPEDWPVQPVVYANVHWMPEGFFDENPALDVPPNELVNGEGCASKQD